MTDYSARFGSRATGVAIGEHAQAVTFVYEDHVGQQSRIGFATLLHLLDRGPQFAALNPLCKTARKATPKRPLLVFVPGSEAQRHQVLLNRFRWFTVPMVENDRSIESIDLVKQYPDAEARVLRWPRASTIETCADHLWEQIAEYMEIDRKMGSRSLCARASKSGKCFVCQAEGPDDGLCEQSLRQLRAKLIWEMLNKNHRAETFYIHVPCVRFDVLQNGALKRIVQLWNTVGRLGVVVPVTVFFCFSWSDSLRDILRRWLPYRRETLSENMNRKREHRGKKRCEACLPLERDYVEIVIVDVLGDIRRDDVTFWLDRLEGAARPIAEKLSEVRDDLEREFGRRRARSMRYVFSRFPMIAAKYFGEQR
jgi:hypothetical protein